MKLLLSSQAISKEKAPYLIELVGKPAKDIHIAVIENAADVETGPKDWLSRNRKMIESHGFNVEYVDLKQFTKNVGLLEQKLATKDVMWFGGGNTYYLRWLIHDLGIENHIREFVNSGKVYGGGSAGSIVAGPTLRHFEIADNLHEAPKIMLDGLSLTTKVILPHMDSKKYAPIMRCIQDKLQADGYQTVPLTDAQALVVNGSEERVI